jgi:hypothetical protein
MSAETRTDRENLEMLAERVTTALDGCGFCRMNSCRADAHDWLKQALLDTTGIAYRPVHERLLAFSEAATAAMHEAAKHQ